MSVAPASARAARSARRRPRIGPSSVGVEVTNIATIWAVTRPDGTLYIDGQGIVTARDGGTASFIGWGFGRLTASGGVSETPLAETAAVGIFPGQLQIVGSANRVNGVPWAQRNSPPSCHGPRMRPIQPELRKCESAPMGSSHTWLKLTMLLRSQLARP